MSTLKDHALQFFLEVYCHPFRRTFSRTPDLHHDGSVNIVDVATVAFAYGATPNSPNWNPAADLNGDGVVNILDVALDAFYYGGSVSM